jgi:hypothetical protein
MLTAIIWAGCSFGLWVFSRYRPIVLEVQEADPAGCNSFRVAAQHSQPRAMG